MQEFVVSLVNNLIMPWGPALGERKHKNGLNK